MFFGSSHCFKSVLAAQLASLLCWSALEGGDRIGGLVFNGERHREIRPRRSRRTVLALLSTLDEFNRELPLATPPGEDAFADMLANLRRVARPGSSLYLVSDFAGAERPHAREHLYQLAQHTEVTAIACADPLEAELPRAGRYAVTDGEARAELQTADRRLRRDYRQRAQQRRQALSAEFQRLGIPLLEAHTDQPPYALLQQYYGDTRR
jgi:uncharacterized protein (DUF58 family)